MSDPYLRFSTKMKHHQELLGWSFDDYIGSIKRQLERDEGAKEVPEIKQLNMLKGENKGW